VSLFIVVGAVRQVQSPHVLCCKDCHVLLSSLSALILCLIFFVILNVKQHPCPHANSITQFDFSIPYTTIPHWRLKNRLKKNVRRRWKYHVFKIDLILYINNHSDSTNKSSLKLILTYLLCLVFFNCAPHWPYGLHIGASLEERKSATLIL
jgi:hypothetical protein